MGGEEAVGGESYHHGGSYSPTCVLRRLEMSRFNRVDCANTVRPEMICFRRLPHHAPNSTRAVNRVKIARTTETNIAAYVRGSCTTRACSSCNSVTARDAISSIDLSYGYDDGGTTFRDIH